MLTPFRVNEHTEQCQQSECVTVTFSGTFDDLSKVTSLEFNVMSLPCISGRKKLLFPVVNNGLVRQCGANS
jgi:hypothetical protein